MIFDRWGEKVYESNEQDFKWDGVYKGELLQPSVCVYVMKAVFLDGHNEKTFKGSLTIVR
jgi:gliding motility-associated-like protein